MLFVLKVAACSRIVPRTHTYPQLVGKAPQIALHVPLKLSAQVAQMAYGQRKTLTQDSWYLEVRLVSSWKVLCWMYRRWKLHSRTFLRRWGFKFWPSGKAVEKLLKERLFNDIIRFTIEEASFSNRGGG
jgi:hypothetical protein